ncbi:hypothetical protein PR001_g13031 [Phytophthora rubi]|uniref:Integrase catalytic domain-containing protein n=1 Tax=Phytophthora rubi TaxID=129364 RepID=A0A6A3LUH8_9STRA|nr:hypothetical protein PR001_g13031 [Phytophthora rubi]
MYGEDEAAPNTGDTLQLTDAEVVEAQQHSRLVQKLMAAGEYRGMPVERSYGLVVVNTQSGKRVVLPPALWAVVFKEMHGSVWAGHLRAPHAYGRVSQLYWRPNLQREVKKWVRGCQDCGSRKARPREVVPPLRSIHGEEVGDRWALDVAGPFPVADGGERYVVAALEYVTRYAVARCVTRHTADNVATFLMEDVVLRFGAFRELLSDGAPELTGELIEKLVDLLQARQVNPVPYRPQMVGLVERFHRSWKDCVATYMANEQQNDWNLWVKFAVYAHTSANHSTVALTPNELMMDRRLRAPNELLRSTQTSEAGELPHYHARLVAAMATSHEHAEAARAKEQERQARYYNRRTRQARTCNPGDRVWIYNPPCGAKATKFVHRWMGPARIIEAAGYDNFLLQREDRSGTREVVIAHVSFLTSYHYPEPLLERAAEDIDAQLEYEAQGGEETMARRPQRLYVQRQYALVQQRHAERQRRQHDVEDGNEKQWLIWAVTSTRVADWWRFDGDGGEIGRDSMSWGMNSDLVGFGASLQPANGCPALSTTASLPAAGSWKTPRLRKACNGARPDARQPDRLGAVGQDDTVYLGSDDERRPSTEPGRWAAEDEVSGRNGRWAQESCLKLGGSVLDVRGMEGRSSETDSHSRICGELRRPHHSGTEECLSKRTDGEKDYGAATYAGQVEQGGSGQQRLSDLLRTANEGQAREACAQVVE